VNVLGTVPARTSGSDADDLLRQLVPGHEREFLDFTVDAVPLREIVRARAQTPNLPRQMTLLCASWPWPRLAVSALRQLLGEEAGTCEDGRVALLVCHVDADFGCGALSAAVVHGDEWVEWRDIGWQVNDPFDAAEDGFEPALTFRFDRSAYTEVLQGLRAQVDDWAAAGPQVGRGSAGSGGHRMHLWPRR
jgi:hypothetical protein